MTANTMLAWRYTVTKVDTVAWQQWTLTDWTKNLSQRQNNVGWVLLSAIITVLVDL